MHSFCRVQISRILINTSLTFPPAAQDRIFFVVFICHFRAFFLFLSLTICVLNLFSVCVFYVNEYVCIALLSF